MRPEVYLPVDLKNAGNGMAAALDTLTQHADVDGSGNAFPLEEFLPDATNAPTGYQPGYYLAPPAPNVSGRFTFTQPEHGYAPLVHAMGQEIPLPVRSAVALHLAALNTGYTNPVTVTIRYDDGTETSLPVNISNWLDPKPSYDEPVLLRSRYLRTARGDDWFLQGAIYAYRLPLDPARKVKSIVLPKLPQVSLFALTLEMPAQ